MQNNNQTNKMRLARFLAQCGVASRRASEKLIEQGKVSVNGNIEKNVATNVDPQKDKILYRGKQIKLEEFVYYILNKPVGYLCSLKAFGNDKIVTQLLPKTQRVYPVGRLDKNSSGLLILTNDGDLAMKLSHPKFESKKVYEVKLDKPCTKEFLDCMKSGVMLTEGLASVDKFEKLSSNTIQITIHQGWKRQIRRMVENCGAKAVSLIRISEGKVKLGDLKVGEYKKVKREDLI
ncbi:rRNA pseudouridine synthase [Patescibacteria group bacterium]|nr:rRNA pseudouridine synthase [Patescibacteria group bacterium]